MPEAIVALGEGKRVVGRLRFESDGRRQQFRLALRRWLIAEERASPELNPNVMPLGAGGSINSIDVSIKFSEKRLSIWI